MFSRYRRVVNCENYLLCCDLVELQSDNCCSQQVPRFGLRETIPKKMEMANRGVTIIAFVLGFNFIFLIMVIPNMAEVSQYLCRERYIQPLLPGKRCITETEEYITKTDISQPVCTWYCLRSDSCDVVNYKITTSVCLLGRGPCILAEQEDQSITTVLSMSRPCLAWVPFPRGEMANAVRFSNEVTVDGRLSVIRVMTNNDRVPGAYSASEDEEFLVYNGGDLYCPPTSTATECQALVSRPECSVAWVDYKSGAGNPLPSGAVPGGTLDGKTLYIAAYFAPSPSVSGGDVFSIGYIDSSLTTATIPHDGGDIAVTDMKILVIQNENPLIESPVEL